MEDSSSVAVAIDKSSSARAATEARCIALIGAEVRRAVSRYARPEGDINAVNEAGTITLGGRSCTDSAKQIDEA